jgi:hypothetical protein
VLLFALFPFLEIPNLQALPMSLPDPHSLRGRQTFERAKQARDSNPIERLIRFSWKKGTPAPRPTFYPPGRTPADCRPQQESGHPFERVPPLPQSMANQEATPSARARRNQPTKAPRYPGGYLASPECHRKLESETDHGPVESARSSEEKVAKPAQSEPARKPTGCKGSNEASDCPINRDTAFMRRVHGENWW